MAEQAACFFRLTPGPDDPATGASFFVRLDPYSTTSKNQALVRVEPLPGVGQALGLEPPGDAGGSHATAKPGKAYLIVRYNGSDHYIGEMVTDGGQPAVEMAFAGMAWSFGVPSRVGDNGKPWTGWEVDLQGLPVPGKENLDILIKYDFDGTLTEVPLVTGGRAWGNSRPFFANPLQITGKGRRSRYNRTAIAYALAAGHGKTHGQIARELVAADGVPDALNSIDASIGAALEKRFEVDSESGTDAAAKVLESYGYRLLESRDGEFTARHMAPVDSPPVATIRGDRIDITADAGVNTDWEQIPACLVVEGSRPVVPDDVDGWSTSERVESFKTETLTIPVANWVQIAVGGSAGTFTATGAYPVEEEETTITERITVRDTTYNGCPVITERFIERIYNPEVWRFRTALPASLDGKPYTYQVGFSFEEDQPAKDDSSPVYLWPKARLILVEYTREEHFRDSEVQEVGGVPVLDPDTGEPIPIGKTGRLAKIEVGVGRWRTRERALRDNPLTGSPPDWSTINITAQLPLLGNGTPVEGDELFFMGPEIPDGAVTTFPAGGNLPLHPLLQEVANLGLFVDTWSEFKQTKINLQEAEDIEEGERQGGWETARRITDFGFERSDGDAYQFLNGETSADDRLAARAILTETRNFIAQGNSGSHTSVVGQTDGEGRALPTITTKNLSGRLPSADVCTRELVLESNQVTVTGQACLPEGFVSLDDEPEPVETLRYDFGVETSAQANRLALILLREMTAARVPVTLPINGLLSILDPIELDVTELGIDPSASTHTSNAWVDDGIKHRDEQDTEGNVRQTTEALLRWAIF